MYCAICKVWTCNENKYEYEYEYEYEHEHEKRMNGIRSDMFIRQLYLICRMQMDEKEWKYATN